MSKMGVPSIRSAPDTSSTGPRAGCCSTRSNLTQDRPMGLGRKGERVANTPIRVFPPRRGGRTVGDQPSRTAADNCQMSQRWENPSSPRRASGFRYSGSKMTEALRASTRPLWRGMPNFVGKSLRILATTVMDRLSIPSPHTKTSFAPPCGAWFFSLRKGISSDSGMGLA